MIEKPVRSAADVAALRRFEPREELGMVLEAIRLLRRELTVPLIGFAGAPFTLASYAIEGGRSNSTTRSSRPSCTASPRPGTASRRLLAEVVRDYLLAQIEAGVQAVQVFDSWVGALNAADYREFVLPHVRTIFEGLRGTGVPTIHFGTGTHAPAAPAPRGGGRRHRPRLARPPRRGLGGSWARGWPCRATSTPPCSSRPASGCSQGVDDVMRRAGGRPGHVFNLGHGILPGTPVENVKAVVDRVQAAALAVA